MIAHLYHEMNLFMTYCIPRPGKVTQAYCPSYSGSKNQEDHGSWPALAISLGIHLN
jgi:hypothetical protein